MTTRTFRTRSKAAQAADRYLTSTDSKPPLGDWVRDALCGGDPRFMSEHPLDLAEAAETCTACPVRGVCLTAGMEGREWGVWGGLTHEDRLRITRGAL